MAADPGADLALIWLESGLGQDKCVPVSAKTDRCKRELMGATAGMGKGGS